MGSALEIIKLLEGICVSLGILGGGVAIVIKCIKAITDSHDRKEKYDAYDGRINTLDKKINTIEKKLDTKIDSKQFEEMQSNMDAKLQQISSELCMLSYCTGATLDGLKQLNCNGKVTEAKEKMDKHLNQQAHGEI